MPIITAKNSYFGREKTLMSCLLKFRWVKLPRNMIPDMKGIMGAYLRLIVRAAICPGRVRYCQYVNTVDTGMWAGGIVGLKSILGVKSSDKALLTLKALSDLNLITFEYKPKTKYLWYRITDYTATDGMTVVNENSVYVFDSNSFVPIPRNLTDTMIKLGLKFDEADAWLDLWCHTVSGDTANVFSCMCPCVQFLRNEAALTLDLLAKRWQWHKLKVQRFLAKNRNVFCLKKLPGSYGSLIFNLRYNNSSEVEEPTVNQINSICRFLKRKRRNNRRFMSDHDQFCRLVLKYTRDCISFFEAKKRVSFPFKRVYCSPCNTIDKGCGKNIRFSKSFKKKGSGIDSMTVPISPFIDPSELFDNPTDIYRYCCRLIGALSEYFNSE